jgi:MraZ protein
VLFASSNYVEIWAKEKYEEVMNDDWDNFSALAEDVMGGQTEQE